MGQADRRRAPRAIREVIRWTAPVAQGGSGRGDDEGRASGRAHDQDPSVEADGEAPERTSSPDDDRQRAGRPGDRPEIDPIRGTSLLGIRDEAQPKIDPAAGAAIGSRSPAAGGRAGRAAGDARAEQGRPEILKPPAKAPPRESRGAARHSGVQAALRHEGGEMLRPGDSIEERPERPLLPISITGTPGRPRALQDLEPDLRLSKKSP